jgi:hypothetical protein
VSKLLFDIYHEIDPERRASTILRVIITRITANPDPTKPTPSFHEASETIP